MKLIPWRDICLYTPLVPKFYFPRFVNETDKKWFQRTLHHFIADQISEEMSHDMLPVPHFVDFMRDAPEPDGMAEEGAEEEELVAPKIYEMVKSDC